jgi:hypothetical protein
MVARMNRIENAARLAMADVGGEATASAPAGQPGLPLAVKVGLVVACLTVTGLIAATLF